MSAGDQPEQVPDGGPIKRMIRTDSKEEALNAVEILSGNGTIMTPLSPRPKPDDSGMGAIVKDAYGYQRIFTCPNPDCAG